MAQYFPGYNANPTLIAKLTSIQNNLDRQLITPAQADQLKQQVMAKYNDYNNTIDPSTGMINIDPATGGYAGNSPVSGLSPGDFSSMLSAYANMYGSSAAANASMYGANAGLQGLLGATKMQTDASMNNAAKGLEASNYGNDAQVKIAGSNNDAIKNVKTQDVNQNLAPNGLYATQKDIAGINANAQLGSAIIPKAMSLQALMSLLQGGGGSGVGGSLAGLGGSLGSLGATLGGLGTGAGSTGSTGTGAGTGAGASGGLGGSGNWLAQSVFGNQAYDQPPMPTFSNYNNVMAQNDISHQNSILSQYEKTLVNRLNSNRGVAGFSASGGPNFSGIKQMNANYDAANAAAMLDNANQIRRTQMQTNNQGQMAAAQQAAQMAATQGDIASRKYSADKLGQNQIQLSLLNGILA